MKYLFSSTWHNRKNREREINFYFQLFFFSFLPPRQSYPSPLREKVKALANNTTQKINNEQVS